MPTFNDSITSMLARMDKKLVAIFGILALIFALAIFYDYLTTEWRFHQREFKNLVEERFGPDRAEKIETGLRQIYVEKLGVTDRCVTCHMGIEWKGLESLPQPYQSHSKGILENHPVEQYGCTSCHGGQGYATEKEAAHGLIKDWGKPMLGAELAEFYVVSNKKGLMQMNCNTCHRYESETKGADFINRAKKIVNEKGCRSCHVINGRGGTIGPDLTYAGDKSPEQYTYERVKGLGTQFGWHVAHLKNPKEVVPGSIMPNFNFNTADAQAVTALVMSWKKMDIPLEYIPGHNVRDIPSEEEKLREHAMLNGPGAFFVKKNCFTCHSVSTLGIEAAAQIGPDLAVAVEDVQSRFGRTLEDFMKKPTGTMDLVLSSMITLTDEERALVVEKLKLAYELKLKERKAGKK